MMSDAINSELFCKQVLAWRVINIEEPKRLLPCFNSENSTPFVRRGAPEADYVDVGPNLVLPSPEMIDALATN
jgi:hypothetical protein